MTTLAWCVYKEQGLSLGSIFVVIVDTDQCMATSPNGMHREEKHFDQQIGIRKGKRRDQGSGRRTRTEHKRPLGADLSCC
jgi:hypothetical protein